MDTHKNKLLNKNTLLFFFIIFAAFFLRIYNLNFEDYWFDEQASFWVSDPTINLNDTIERSNELDRGSNIVFNLFLKIFFLSFGYDPQIGRYLPFIFGLLSIPTLCYLVFQISKNQSYLLVGFLSAINFYLISYSQEVRVYSFIFLLSTLSLIFFLKLLDEENLNNKKYLYACSYIFFSLLGVLLHTFFFIIIISQFLFILLNIVFNKKKFVFILFCILSIPLLFLILMYDYLLLQLGIKSFWIQQVNLDFFINYFFSRFFGSKIMGAIYLLCLIYLIYTGRKKILKLEDKNFLLILILVLSYVLPLTYGLIKQPILIDRYIIFVLVPIFALISILIFELKNTKIKYIILFIILSSSLINNYIEIFNREKSKPEFNKILKYISKSNNPNIIAKTNDTLTEKIVINYSKNTITSKNSNLNFYSSNNDYSKLNALWILCYKPINGFDCSPTTYLSSSWLKVDDVEYKLIESTLYKN